MSANPPLTSNDLDEHRRAIDEIDARILELINQRLTHANAIGRIKAQQSQPVLDSAREAQVIQRLNDLNQGPLKKNALSCIFTDIIAAAREIQRPPQISFLGPEATFTHIAAMNHFGRNVEFLPQTEIRDIFSEVEKEACHFGVVPVENSIEGTVNYTLDLFFETDLLICAEIYQHISHDLLSKTGSRSDIRVIYSHPHAFAQCRQWLGKNLPEAVTKDCVSTAQAARQAASEAGAAAIASSMAAQIYDLQLVSARIEDHTRNITRFLVIGRDNPAPTGMDKTSILFVTANQPGALYKVLAPISEAGINMVKLESRPTKRENWRYFFFVDLEGHREDAHVAEALDRMQENCLFVKCLGSYPRGQEGE